MLDSQEDLLNTVGASYKEADSQVPSVVTPTRRSNYCEIKTEVQDQPVSVQPHC